MNALMLYSAIHGAFYRISNKLNREKKKRSLRIVPANTSNTYKETENQLFEPQLMSPSTVAPDCSSARTVQGVLNIIENLEADKYLTFVKNYYKEGLNKFGDSWVYADINTVLYALCQHMNIESYLEIGVRRGRSMSIVASQIPNCSITGFDLWIPNYCGVDNPGQEFVKGELNKVGFKGSVEFVAGDSKKTVPEYFKQNPNAYYDLITVDGDHSIGGAVTDLNNILPHLKIGGVVVFDDICSHEHPYLAKVWNRVVADKKNFAAYSFTELGLGIGFAIRKY